ncbi:MAG TPA: hypothetical protein VGE78_12280, partial [Agromyces sp.]
AYDTELVGVGDGGEAGSVDAVAVDLSDSGGPGVVVARAFTSIGEGVAYELECDDQRQVASVREEVDRLLAVKLIPAY